MGQKPYEIYWSEKAINQIKGIYDYIAKSSVFNAIKVRDDISKAICFASTNPYHFPPDKYKKDNKGSYRSFTKHRFRVSYRIFKESIRIIRIRHTSMSALNY